MQHHELSLEQLIRSSIGTGEDDLKAAIRLVNVNYPRFYKPSLHGVQSGNPESMLFKQLFKPVPDSGTFEKGHQVRVSISGIGGGGGADQYISGGEVVGNDLRLDYNTGGSITIPGVIENETLYYFSDTNPNITPPTQNVGDRPLQDGDLVTLTTNGTTYKKIGVSWVVVYDPFNEYEEGILDGSGSYTFTAGLLLSQYINNPSMYDLYKNGVKQYINNSDFTVSGQTVQFDVLEAGNFISLQRKK